MKVLEGNLNAKGLSFCIVVSRFNDFITSRLVDGAVDALLRHGADEKEVQIVRVPGSFELPLIAKKCAASGRYHAVIALGTIIRGATPHFDFVASEAAKGIAMVSLEAELPVSFGIITADSIEQAVERAGSKSGNKGWDAALTAIEMANLVKTLPKR
ncbi:MAG: 6,7-dimethyl-8-ribityllumazine synthase [Thermodesulfovibrionales bacterium]